MYTILNRIATLLHGLAETYAAKVHKHSASDINEGVLSADRIANGSVTAGKLADSMVFGNSGWVFLDLPNKRRFAWKRTNLGNVSMSRNYGTLYFNERTTTIPSGMFSNIEGIWMQMWSVRGLLGVSVNALSTTQIGYFISNPVSETLANVSEIIFLIGTRP